jgi:hypothetical protein
MITVPTPVRDSLFPENVAGPETTLSSTGNPEEEVALIQKGEASKFREETGDRVMVWEFVGDGDGVAEESGVGVGDATGPFVPGDEL